MEKNKIFFGEKGITSTLANTVCNWAKELYQGIDEFLSEIQFYSESIKLLDSNATPYVISGGYDTANFDNYLQEKCKLQSLIAWLREAIKAKEEIVNYIKNMSVEEIAKQLDISIPEEPTKEHILTEDEYIASLSVKERNRYFYLETLCAVYGKFIHPNGNYSLARKQLAKILQKPNKVNGSGKDITITIYTPTISLETVDEKFFELQQKHREAQAELNGMKHKMELAIEASKDASDKKYEQEYAEYSTAYKELINIISIFKNDKLIEVRNSKIIIPNDLADIYNKVVSVGKDKQ